MARNAGLKIATGKWITFIDSDDTIHPSMIDLLHRLCYQNKTKMSICSFYEVKSDGTGNLKPHQPNRETVLTTTECLKAMLCEEGFSMSAWGKLYARELFDLVEFPPHRLYEDVGTTYKLVLQCDRIAVSNAEYYNYYQTPGSITQQGFNLHKMDLIDLTDQMCDDILAWSASQDLTAQELLDYLTRKRRMHARFSILRQMVIADRTAPTSNPVDTQSFKHAEKQVVRYLRIHKNDILKNPLATRRDKLAMYSLLAGKPIFRYAWQKYSAKRHATPSQTEHLAKKQNS